MPHDNENPLIIDVVGEVEPPQPSEQQAPKKSGRSTSKKGFFKKEKKTAGTTATQAASEAEVDAAKRAAVAASVPPVQGPASQTTVSQDAPAQSEPQVQHVVATEPEQYVPGETPQDVQPEQSSQVQEAPQADQAPAQVQQPVQSQPPTQQPVQQMPLQQPVQQAQPQQPIQQSAVSSQSVQTQVPLQQTQQPIAQPAGAEQPQAAMNPQPQAVPQAAQPLQPAAVAAPMIPQVQSAGMAAAVAAPPRSRAIYVFAILAAAVVLFAMAAVGFFMFFPSGNQTPLAPTVQTDAESDEVRPIGSVSLDQASKVSLRATAEGWNEETSTPIIAYIKRVEDASGGDSDKQSSGSSVDTERYFAFAPNKNASVSLPAGRYTFSFIAPMNSDGSMYSVPDMVNMVVGDGGMAVLPIDLTLIPKADLTQEQVTRALAQLKTASEKGGESFDYEPFKKSIELALSTWFPQSDTTTEQPATDLTQEQQDALNAQADSQSSSQANGGAANNASTEHTHDWIAQHEQRWEPEVIPVIDTPAWESPVYARYRCQEGILFETLDACLAHVRERGNEPYTASNEIIRIDYHPAVVHYEEQGRYVDVVTGYRCSICGVRGTLS